MTDDTTFDARSGTAEREAAIRRVDRHADPHWVQCWAESTIWVARRKPFFNTSDIWRRLRTAHPNASTHEHRAVGPRMRAAQKRGICAKTQDFALSGRRSNHNSDIRTWVSLIYEGPKFYKPRRRKIIDPRQYALLLLDEPEE